MNKTFKAITFTDVNKIAVREYELGACGHDQIVVRTRYSMVSSGTELRVLAGYYDAAGQYPLIPGYSAIGEVIEVGKQVTGYRVGDRVSCKNPQPVPGVHLHWGGQSGLQVQQATGQDRPILLPNEGDWLDYVAVEISAISLRGVSAASPKPGEIAVVLGQGLIGAFSAAWLDAAGCRVIVADMEQSRLERARQWSSATVNVSEPDAISRIQNICNGGANIVVECSGTPRGAQMAYALVRRSPNGSREEPIQLYHSQWSRLVMQANYVQTVNINPFGFCPGEGVTILSPHDRSIEDRQNALEQFRRGTLSSRHFIQNIASIKDAPSAYAALRDDKDQNFSLVFDWDKA
jgi:2-desacetyl-2-hydroxyethyl bacteriochlorophyllide A dehydrogenase